MQNEKFYKILTYILIPCSFIALFFALLALLMVLSNPQMIIMAFFLACIVIYSFKSAKFYFLNIQKDTPAKNADKAWIRINGFITLFIAFQLILSGIMVIRNPAMITENLALLYANVPQEQMQFVPGKQVLAQFVKNLSIAFLVYGSLQTIHVLISLSLLRKYNYLFSE